ncbi:hypothetical protein V2J09_000358 [Rumex salicifolius]
MNFLMQSCSRLCTLGLSLTATLQKMATSLPYDTNQPSIVTSHSSSHLFVAFCPNVPRKNACSWPKQKSLNYLQKKRAYFVQFREDVELNDID